MSGRNYRPSEGPLGKIRESFPVAPETPKVNTDGLMALQAWRVVDYKKPILDDIIAWYRFDPPTAETAEIYAGKKRYFSKTARAVGQEAVRQLIASKQEKLAAGQRQVGHIAEGAESALALYWMVAEGRKEVLEQVLSAVINEKPVDHSVGYQAAEAIEDMGHCLHEPFEPVWDKRKREIVTDQRVIAAVNTFAPEVGVQIIGFGRHAADYQEALATDTGIILMQSAIEEQEFRIAAWRPRHNAVLTAFPEIEPSMDILLDRVPLNEMIRSQERFRH